MGSDPDHCKKTCFGFGKEVLKELSKDNRKAGVEMAKTICKDYRRTGRYFDEIMEDWNGTEFR